MSLLLKDGFIYVVIVIHLLIGLLLALDWTVEGARVEATTWLTVHSCGCQGSKLVIASSRFFASCSLIYLSVVRIKSLIPRVVGLGEWIVTFSLDFGRGELVADSTCSWRQHLVASDIWQDSLTSSSTVVWSLTTLTLAGMLLSLLMCKFTLLSWLIILSLHHRPFLMYVGQKTLVLIWRCSMLQLCLTRILSRPYSPCFSFERRWTWSYVACDVIWDHLRHHVVVIGRHIGRLWHLLHPVVTRCLHVGVLINLLLDSQKMLRLISPLLLIALFAGIKAGIWRIFQSHLLQLLVQLVLIHHIFLFSRPTSEFGAFLLFSLLHFEAILVLLNHVILIRSRKWYRNIHVDGQRLVAIRCLMPRLCHWMICFPVVLVRIHGIVVVMENRWGHALWIVTVIILRVCFLWTFLLALQFCNCFRVHFELFIVQDFWV